jgi:hypothetical protein
MMLETMDRTSLIRCLDLQLADSDSPPGLRSLRFCRKQAPRPVPAINHQSRSTLTKITPHASTKQYGGAGISMVLSVSVECRRLISFGTKSDSIVDSSIGRTAASAWCTDERQRIILS